MADTPKKQRRARGDGGVRFHKASGLYVGEIELSRDPDTGRRRRRTIYAKSKAQAQRDIRDLLIQSGGTVRAPVRGTVGDFVDRWLEEDVRPNRSPNTIALYESVWTNHVAPLMAKKTMDKVAPGDVSALYAQLTDRGASTSMRRRVGNMMRTIFRVAIRRGAYAAGPNPFEAVELPAHKAKKGESLSIDQAKRFIAAARDDRFEALWLLSLTAGLRLGEALALRWKDVDLDRGTASISRTLLEVGGHVSFGDTKTSGSRRLVVLGQIAKAALKRRRKAYDAEEHGSELIFSTLDGTPMRRSNLRRSHFIPVLKTAKIPHLRIHDLRHSMASIGIAAGIGAKILADRLGHTTTRLTQDRYAHILAGIDGGAAQAIDRMLK